MSVNLLSTIFYGVFSNVFLADAAHVRRHRRGVHRHAVVVLQDVRVGPGVFAHRGERFCVVVGDDGARRGDAGREDALGERLVDDDE